MNYEMHKCYENLGNGYALWNSYVLCKNLNRQNMHTWPQFLKNVHGFLCNSDLTDSWIKDLPFWRESTCKFGSDGSRTYHTHSLKGKEFIKFYTCAWFYKYLHSWKNKFSELIMLLIYSLIQSIIFLQCLHSNLIMENYDLENIHP